MKKEIFIQYLEAVLKLYGVERTELLSGNKKPDAIEARQMLYYLCYQRQIKICQIQRFMIEQGYDPKTPPILQGIRRTTKKVDADQDYQTVTERIANSIFI
jgi:hypothetical protein